VCGWSRMSYGATVVLMWTKEMFGKGNTASLMAVNVELITCASSG